MYPFPFSAQSNAIGTNSSATATISAALPGKGNTIRIFNEGPNVAFISIGTAAQTATLPSGTPLPTATPVPIGDTTLSIPNDVVQNYSVICRATQTAVLTLQVGEGQ